MLVLDMTNLEDAEPFDKIGAHLTHCCVLHGCKYGDDDCPVEDGSAQQEFLCEECPRNLAEAEHLVREALELRDLVTRVLATQN